MLLPSTLGRTMSTVLSRDAVLDQTTPVMRGVWNRDVGPENPLRIRPSEDGSEAFARQVDFEEDAIPSFGEPGNGAFGEPPVPMRTIDPALGNTVDILA